MRKCWYVNGARKDPSCLRQMEAHGASPRRQFRRVYKTRPLLFALNTASSAPLAYLLLHASCEGGGTVLFFFVLFVCGLLAEVRHDVGKLVGNPFPPRRGLGARSRRGFGLQLRCLPSAAASCCSDDEDDASSHQRLTCNRSKPRDARRQYQV